MAQQKQLIDGHGGLDAQENALNLAEQMLAAKVIRYGKTTSSVASGDMPNEALLEDVPIGDPTHSLYLKAIDVTSNPSLTTARQPGLSLVFQGVAYVSGVERLVLGFRQI